MSLIYLPCTNPFWSSFINKGRVVVILFPIQVDPILYTTFSYEIGFQFLRYSLGLSPLGIHIVADAIFPFFNVNISLTL